MVPAAAAGQDAGVHAEPAPIAEATPAADALPAGEALTIPALTVVEIEIGAELGSKISTSGDRFPITLKAPIVIDGREAIPAGTAGEGEVVHAKKAGGSGTPGELVLAARFLTVGERRLRLRSMRVGQVGKDNMGTVTAIGAASAAVALPLALLGFAIAGGNTVYPQGSLASAKTAEAFVVEPSIASLPAAADTTFQTGGTNQDAQQPS